MNESIAKDKQVLFIAKGVILGYTWGADYKSLMMTEKYIAKDLNLMKKDLESDFDKKALNHYGDFESYKGAYIEVIQRTTYKIDGEIFTNEKAVEPIVLGKLYNDEIDTIKTKLMLGQI